MEDFASPGEVEDCPSCGGAIDVSGQAPFAPVLCPHCGGAMHARRLFNNFELVGLIGEGGMGTVFKALDHNLGRPVALKVLRREVSGREEERAKLAQEARITASVNHPHVVRVYSFGEARGQFYLAMELVEKGSLDDLMSVQGRVAEAQVLGIGVQIAQGLEAAAEKGLVHRDIKPGNILFADARTAKIVDFGLARVMEEEAGARGEIWGTPYYIAPERLNYEKEDFRSDIYSLGGTLFHAIAGRPPFEAQSASLVALKQLKSQPVSLEAFAPDVAPETAYVINRMLEKNPADRYGSYAELVEHLDFARAKVLAGAGRPTSSPREVVRLESGRTKLFAAFISLAAALLLLAAGWWLAVASERPEIRELREALWGDREASAAEPMSASLQALADGEIAAAEVGLIAVAKGAEPGSERAQWASFNLALTAALAGERQTAHDRWRNLARSGLFSDRPEDRDLANMFLDAGEFGQRRRPVRLEDLARYPGEGPGALVFLVAGVTEWAAGEKAEAKRLLGHFLDVAGSPQTEGWDSYRKIAAGLRSES